jgi:hypothetical protein
MAKLVRPYLKNTIKMGRTWWFIPAIPTIQEKESKRIAVHHQSRQK